MTADLTKTVQCPYCAGEGGSMSAEEYDWSECSECCGAGAMTIAAIHDAGWSEHMTKKASMSQPCPKCNGEAGNVEA